MLLSIEQIAKEISDKNITAISLDTSIVDAQQRSLEYGLLKRLNQFRGSSIEVVLSDVVIHEIEEHLNKDATEALSSLKKALKLLGNAWQVFVTDRNLASSVLLKGDSPKTVAQRRVNNFIAATGAAVLKAEHFVNVGQLVNQYFLHSPPFSNNETKKHEFPDAFALLTLEAWAEQKNTLVLVVTKDGDWRAYCESSSRLVAIDDLAEALSCFQREISISKCKYLSQQLLAEDPLGIKSKVEEAINDQSSKIEFVPEADSQFYYEVDGIEAEFQISDFIETDDQLILEPVEEGENYLVVRIMLAVVADVTCDFSFAKWDSIDKEYFPMGTATVSTTEDSKLEVLLTIIENEPNRYEIGEIEVIGSREHIEFGEIEPDWMNEPDN